jgi:hypothetical protein
MILENVSKLADKVTAAQANYLLAVKSLFDGLTLVDEEGKYIEYYKSQLNLTDAEIKLLNKIPLTSLSLLPPLLVPKTRAIEFLNEKLNNIDLSIDDVENEKLLRLALSQVEGKTYPRVGHF